MSPVPLPDLERAIPTILGGWRGQLRARKGKNHAARSGARGAAEVAFVEALLRAAVAQPADEGTMRGLVMSAITYGSTERIRRLEPAELCRELGVLRNEIWRRVHEYTSGQDPVLATKFVQHLDHAVTIASSAVLRGGFACELEKLGIAVVPGSP
jgi:hypothetical protein